MRPSRAPRAIGGREWDGCTDPQPFTAVIQRVAVQVRLAAPLPKGDLLICGLAHEPSQLVARRNPAEAR